MSFRRTLHPGLESLEKKTVLSAGAHAAPAAVVAQTDGLEPGAAGPQLASHENASAFTSTQIENVALNGQAKGTYTSRIGPPDTGALYHLNASGAITPIGSAVVTGSFHTAGFIRGQVAGGTLTIVGPKGTLHLNLTDSAPVPFEVSTDQHNPINPGGPMIPASTGTGGSIVSPPIILVNKFEFKIVSGTGQYAHDRGTGTVQIETTPGLLAPTGPGIYAGALATTTGVGRTLLSFTST